MSERLVERTWLELGADPAVAPSPPPDGVRLARCVPCSPARYLELYRAVGAPWNWVDRLGWPADRLAAHLADPDVLVFEATGDGTLAGYFELQRHPDRSVELAYFGLVPEALGRGIGRWLL
ncbi:MAG: GNAT family N-acetyltransferase, partial [Gemmatimonadales bacterium]|nr:GNAT family N-acetyltransferase [Gemmatimonadales bacterium]